MTKTFIFIRLNLIKFGQFNPQSIYVQVIGLFNLGMRCINESDTRVRSTPLTMDHCAPCKVRELINK